MAISDTYVYDTKIAQINEILRDDNITSAESELIAAWAYFEAVCKIQATQNGKWRWKQLEKHILASFRMFQEGSEITEKSMRLWTQAKSTH